MELPQVGGLHHRLRTTRSLNPNHFRIFNIPSSKGDRFPLVATGTTNSFLDRGKELQMAASDLLVALTLRFSTHDRVTGRDSCRSPNGCMILGVFEVKRNSRGGIT